MIFTNIDEHDITRMKLRSLSSFSLISTMDRDLPTKPCREVLTLDHIVCCVVLYCIVLYCIDGVVITVQCTTIFFKIYCVPPNLGITST